MLRGDRQIPVLVWYFAPKGAGKNTLKKKWLKLADQFKPPIPPTA